MVEKFLKIKNLTWAFLKRETPADAGDFAF
jgi:hypothetical protein